jgi:HlyD family secretion protein
MTAGHEQVHEQGYARRVALALGLCAFLLIGVGGWAATSSLSGAVLAPGLIVVESNVKKVQHPTGGIVGAILVRNGDVVQGGDLLIRLDDTQTRANLGVVKSQLTELTGRKARLAAERDGSTAVEFPNGYEETDAEAMRVAEGERRLFAAKRKSIEGQKAQLRERIGQFRHEISGLTRQEKAKSSELQLVKEELQRVEEMYEKRLTPVTRVLAMQRDATRIEGEHGSVVSQIARATGQIAETEIKLLEMEETLRADAQKELRDVEARIAELNERKVSAEDMLQRVDLRAPQTGIIHELAVHTVGGVISPGETIMAIVPLEDEKAVEVRLAPTDIDQVSVGQKARLRFPAFNQRTTPELDGSIARVAPDLTKDPQSGAAYYVARIKIAGADLAAFKQMKLVAGMPVESYIETGERTALSYLTKPFTDQLQRAFREE